ncbi:MAG: hypothetical protein KDI15_04010, partial [Thiothrix sp.]|nr:hypothetical protein [Thiothrix sp.]
PETAGVASSVIHGAGGAVGGSVSGISDIGHALDAAAGTLVRYEGDILPSYMTPEEVQFMQRRFPKLMGIGTDPIYQAGQAVKDFTATENPSTIPAAIGSALGTLGTVAVGGLAGLGAKGATALGMAQSANQLANEGADDYRETLEKQGKPLDASQLANTTLLNSALSLADAFPGGRLAKSMGLTALDDATGGFIKKAVLGAASEGATEVAQTLAQNWIANGIVKYDPDRDTWEGADEALVGGAGAGAFMNSLVHLIGGRRVSGTGGESGINETQTAPETRSTTTTAQSVNPLDSFVEQEAGEAVTQVSRELAGTERQAAAQPQASGLSALISSGEGGYGSYNRGKAGDANGAEIDFSQMTVAELMQAQALPEGDQNRIFAFGKYQIIPSTLQEAVRALRIDPNTSVTPELQERIFSGFLLKGKRPDIEGYITGRHDDLTRAQKAGSQEWASIANPETGRSYYDGTGNNSASISADQFGAGLQAARAAYRQAIESGAEPEQAWQQAIGTPAPAANGQTAAGQPPSDVQTGNGEITIRINSGYQQTARQQPEPTPDNYIEPPGTSAIFPEPVTAGPQDTVPAADNTPEQQQIQLPDGTTTTTTTGQPETTAIRQADIYDAENNRYQAEYDIIDAATLTPTIDKADNQYRDRTRTALQAQVDSIAANPVYGRLNTQHSTFTDGAPVLANGDTLIAGNGRMAGLKQAYEQGTADNYRQQLTQDAGRLGFDTEAISRMQQPVLVRRMQGDVNTSKLAVLSNIGTGAAMSDLEQAKVDAGYIKHLGDFNPADDAEINFQSAPGLFQRLRSAAPEGERNNIMTADGKVSADGARRVKNALMYMAYGDSPVLADMVESQDPDHINITKALVQAAPRLAEMRDSIRQGIIYDADITPDIVQSFSLFKQIRRDQGNTIDSWIRQQHAFSQTPETVKTLIRRLDEGSKKPGQLRDFLNAYADKLKTYGNPN